MAAWRCFGTQYRRIARAIDASCMMMQACAGCRARAEDDVFERRARMRDAGSTDSLLRYSDCHFGSDARNYDDIDISRLDEHTYILLSGR